MLCAGIGRITRVAIWAIFALVAGTVSPVQPTSLTEHEEHRSSDVARFERTLAPSSRSDVLPSVTSRHNWLLSHPSPDVWFETPLPHCYFDLRNGRGLSLLC